MNLVDTTVWIDYFNDKKDRKTERFEELIKENEDICICGVITAEVLQGIRDDKEYEKVKDVIEGLLYLPDSRETHILAAQIYRKCRKKGITIRKPIDCIIAAICIENSAFLLHNDRDFDYISKVFPLQFL